MPKNKVKFQNGLSLPSILFQYGTEQQCRESLFSMRWPNGFCCPNISLVILLKYYDIAIKTISCCYTISPKEYFGR